MQDYAHKTAGTRVMKRKPLFCTVIFSRDFGTFIVIGSTGAARLPQLRLCLAVLMAVVAVHVTLAVSPHLYFQKWEEAMRGGRGKASGEGCTVGFGLAPRTCSVNGSELGNTKIWID